jgi:ribose transport system substrate-binding protein
MKMKKVFFLVVAVLMITGLMFVGCAPAAVDTAQEAPAEDVEEAPAEDVEDSEDVAEEPAALPDVALPADGNVEAVAVAEEPLRIAFLSFANNPFWNAIEAGALAGKDYLANFNTTVDYIVMGEDLTSEMVTAAIDVAITKEYDAIVVVPVFDGTEIFCDKAIEAGIPVATFCAESTTPGDRLFFYGQNGYAAGQLAGELIEDYTGGEGKVGVISGFFGAPIHDARMNGAIDYLADNTSVEILGPFENLDKGETAYNQTTDMLTANPDLKMVYVTAGGPFGAAKAIQDLGKTGEIGVVAYDHIPDNLVYVQSGEIVGLINQDPFGQGFDTVVMMHNYLTTGVDPGVDFVEAALDVVTPDDVGDFYPDYK